MQTLDERDFAERLTQAVRASGLTASRISERLADMGTPCSLATLRSWEKGDSLPQRESSLKVIKNLEKLLALRPGELAQAANRPRAGTSAWWRSANSTDALFGRNSELGKVIERYDGGRRQFQKRLLSTTSVHLDISYSVARLGCSDVLQAQGGPLEGTVILGASMGEVDGEGRPQLFDVEMFTGGQVAESQDFPDLGVVAHRITFDRPLLDGESLLLEYAVVPRSPEEKRVPLNRYELRCLRPCAHALLNVVFPTGSEPAWARGRLRAAHDDPREKWNPADRLPLVDGIASLGASLLNNTTIVIEWGAEQ